MTSVKRKNKKLTFGQYFCNLMGINLTLNSFPIIEQLFDTNLTTCSGPPPPPPPPPLAQSQEILTTYSEELTRYLER